MNLMMIFLIMNNKNRNQKTATVIFHKQMAHQTSPSLQMDFQIDRWEEDLVEALEEGLVADLVVALEVVSEGLEVSAKVLVVLVEEVLDNLVALAALEIHNQKVALK